MPRNPYQRTYGLDLPRHTSKEVMSAAREAVQAKQANSQKGQPMPIQYTPPMEYILIDDDGEVWATRYLTQAEAEKLNQEVKAKSGGDGKVRWELKAPLTADSLTLTCPNCDGEVELAECTSCGKVVD